MIRKLLSWFFIFIGVAVGILAVGVVGSYGLEYTLLYPLLGTLAAIAPLRGTWLALTNERSAYLWFLASAPLTFVLFGVLTLFALRFGMIPYAEVNAIAWTVAGVGCAAGALAPYLFWRLAHRRQWSPLMDKSKSRRARVAIAVTAMCAIVLLAIPVSVAIAVRRPDIGDCGRTANPYAAQWYPGHTMFVARIVYSDQIFGTVAVVEEHFFGLSWLNKKFIISDSYAGPYAGKRYLMDMNRDHTLLAGLANVVRVRGCGRSKPVEYAAVDLRLLREGARSGARIAGLVMRLKSNIHDSINEFTPISGVQVTATGPAGARTATTDQEGIYEFTGLPAGEYTVQLDPSDARTKDYQPCQPFQSRREETWDKPPLRADEIWECSMYVPPRPRKQLVPALAEPVMVHGELARADQLQQDHQREIRGGQLP